MHRSTALSRSVLCLWALAVPALAQRIAPAPAPPAGPIPIPAPPDDIAMPEPYLPRTLAIRCESGDASAPLEGWISTRGHAFHRIPKLAASVVVEEDDTNLAITFSAEAYAVGPAGTRLFVRALVDRVVAEPSDVVFTQDGFQGARSFTFTAVVDAGIHTVEMEWMVDDLGSQCAGTLRAASLELRTGKDDGTQTGTLTLETPSSGPQESTRFDTFGAIPGMEVPFFAPEKCSVVVTFSAEAAVSNDGESFLLRATVDGDPMQPANVVFARTERYHCRTMIFGETILAPGWHDLAIEWAVANPGETAYVGDRSVVISCYPKNVAFGQYFVSPPSGPMLTNDQTSFVSLPGLQQAVKMPANAELSVKVAGEFYGLGTVDVLLRLEVGGVILAQDTVAFFRGGNEVGVKSFAFDVKHQFAGLQDGELRQVKLCWAAGGTGTAFVGDRAMAIVVEPGDVPDLAEPAPFGGPDPLIEPAVGTRKVLTIFWDPHRAGQPAFDKATIVDSLFGPENSMADYFRVVSAGRFALENAGTLGYYDALMPADHYWVHPECNDAGNDGFRSGHQEKWYEALQLADPDFDYSVHDRDGDGVIRYDELGILMVIPQADNDGTAQVSLSPFCNGQPVVFDGVQIEGLVEWYVTDPYASVDPESQLVDYYAYSTAAHELAHLILRLPDMYVNRNPDGQYADDDTHTEPGRFSLMANNAYATPHPDPMHRMALGWAAPTWVAESGWYELEDVRATGELLVLPRRNGGDGREYFVLEHRRTPNLDGLYDDGVGGNGLVLWHVIADPLAHANPPGCMAANEWLDKANNFARRGVRVLRPDIAYIGTMESVWNLEDAYNLDGYGLVCPGQGTPHNALLWSDWTPSRYQIGGFSSQYDLVQTFYVLVPNLP